MGTRCSAFLFGSIGYLEAVPLGVPPPKQPLSFGGMGCLQACAGGLTQATPAPFWGFQPHTLTPFLSTAKEKGKKKRRKGLRPFEPSGRPAGAKGRPALNSATNQVRLAALEECFCFNSP